MAKRIKPEAFAAAVVERAGTAIVSFDDLKSYSVENDYLIPGVLWQKTKVDTDKYDLSAYLDGTAAPVDKAPAVSKPAASPVAAAPAASVESPAPVAAPEPAPVAAPEPAPSAVALEIKKSVGSVAIIPEKDPLYIPFGNHKKLEKIVKANRFFPVFLTGLSGNGKTFTIEQVCARLKRKFIRVNITNETDEDDLIGGFRLINGDTVWNDGPVITAMREGAVLLLDEISFGGSRILSLQSVLEGKGYYIKKTGEYVKPEKGFTIIAADNTKGRGSEDGKFAFTNILNEAFLERFKMWFTQEYPSKAVEKRILTTLLKAEFKEDGLTINSDDEDFIDTLVKWGDITRKAFNEGAHEDLITTRRLVGAIEAYVIFERDKSIAIQASVERFEDETKGAFIDLYTKLDGGLSEEDAAKILKGESDDDLFGDNEDEKKNDPF